MRPPKHSIPPLAGIRNAWALVAVLCSYSISNARVEYSSPRVSHDGFTVEFATGRDSSGPARTEDVLFAFSSIPGALPSVSVRVDLPGAPYIKAQLSLAGYHGGDYVQWISFPLPGKGHGGVRGTIAVRFGIHVYAETLSNRIRLRNGILTIPLASGLPKAASPQLPSIPYRSGIRIEVAEDGIYQITGDELTELGIPISSIPARSFRLFERDREIPLFLTNGDRNTLSNQDRILFYGRALRGAGSFRAQFSNGTMYWLVWETGRPGVRMADASGAIRIDEMNYREDLTGVALHARAFPDTLHLETDASLAWLGSVADAAEMGTASGVGDSVDNWYWGGIGTNELTHFTVAIPSPSPSEAGETSRARMRVAYRGLTDVPSSNRDHEIHLLINGSPPLPGLAPAVWDGQNEFVYETPVFPVSPILVHGTNTVTFRTPQDRGFVDRSSLNWIEVEYYRVHRALDDQIRFRPHPQDIGTLKQFTIVEFSTASLDLWDIGNHRVLRDFRVRRAAGKDKGLSLVFQDSLTQPAMFVAQAVSRRRSPVYMTLDTIRPGWSFPAGAEYVMISTRELLPLLEPLAAIHRGRGLTVALVSIEDIYNRFAYGIRDPESIRSFLRYLIAVSGGRPPRYLLLGGDTSHDLDKVPGTRSLNLVPTHLSRVPSWGPCSDDGFFANVRGDDLIPDLHVGRFPARNAADMNVLVRKTIAYIEYPQRGPWHDNVLIIGGHDSVFVAYNDNLVSEVIGPRMNINRMDARPGSPYYHNEFIASKRIADHINTGVYFVSFNGHGGGNIWSDSRFFSFTDIARLYNHTWGASGYLPVVFSFTCLTGFFESVLYRSLGEEFVRTGPQGAIGFYGASAYTSLSGNLIMNRILLEHGLRGEFESIGELLSLAETNMLALDLHRYLPLARQYNYLGDPAVPWRVPPDSIKLTLDKSVLTASDSLVIRGQCTPVREGTVRLTVGPDPVARWTERTATMHSGEFTSRIALKDSASVARGLVRAFAWNGDAEASGWAGFSRNSLFVTDVRIDPPDPAFGDSVIVSCVLEMLDSLESDQLYCTYTIDSPHSSGADYAKYPGITMSRDNAGRWIASRPLVVVYPGRLDAELLIKFRLPAIAGESNRFAFPIRGLPDLLFTGSVPQIIWSGDSLRFRFSVLNAGNLAAVRVEADLILGGTGMPVRVQTTESLMPGVIREFSVALADTAGLLPFTVILNPDGGMQEISTHDNQFSGMLDVTYRDLDSPEDTLFSRGAGVRISPARRMGRSHRVFLFGAAPGSGKPLMSASRWMPLRGDSLRQWEIRSRPPLAGDSLRWRFIQEIPNAAKSRTITTECAAVMVYDSTVKGWRAAVRSRDPSDHEIVLQTPQGGLFAAALLSDLRPPEIRVSVAGRYMTFLDYAAKDKPFDIFINDPSGLLVSSVVLRLNGRVLDSSAVSWSSQGGSGDNLRLTAFPSRQRQIDSLVISAGDRAGNDTDVVFAFMPGEDLKIRFLTCHPNPFSAAQDVEGRTIRTIRFAYLLTDVADEVKLSLHTISDKTARTWTLRNVIGYQELEWDGKTREGFRIANGTYYLKMVAKNRRKRVKKIIKIAKLEGF